MLVPIHLPEICTGAGGPLSRGEPRTFTALMDAMSTISELNSSRIHLEMLQPESGNPNV